MLKLRVYSTALILLLPHLAHAMQCAESQLVYYDQAQHNWSAPQSIDSHFVADEMVSAGTHYAWARGNYNCPLGAPSQLSLAFYNGTHWQVQTSVPWDAAIYPYIHFYPATPTTGTLPIAWMTEDRRYSLGKHHTHSVNGDDPLLIMYSFDGSEWQRDDTILDGFAQSSTATDFSMTSAAGFAYLAGRCDTTAGSVLCYKVSSAAAPTIWSKAYLTPIKDDSGYVYTYDDATPLMFILSSAAHTSTLFKCDPQGKCKDIHHFTQYSVGELRSDDETMYAAYSVGGHSVAYTYSHDKGVTWYTTPPVPFTYSDEGFVSLMTKPVHGMLCLSQSASQPGLTSLTMHITCIDTNQTHPVWSKVGTLTIAHQTSEEGMTTASGALISVAGDNAGNPAHVYKYTAATGEITDLNVPATQITAAYPAIHMIGNNADTILSCGQHGSSQTLDAYNNGKWQETTIQPMSGYHCKMASVAGGRAVTQDDAVWAYWPQLVN